MLGGLEYKETLRIRDADFEDAKGYPAGYPIGHRAPELFTEDGALASSASDIYALAMLGLKVGPAVTPLALPNYKLNPGIADPFREAAILWHEQGHPDHATRRARRLPSKGQSSRNRC